MGRHWARRRAGSVGAAPAEVVDLMADLQGHWKLEEAAGLRMDSVSTHHLTPHGAVSRVEGKVGSYCVQFSSETSDYLECATSPHLQPGLGGFSVNCWVFFDSASPAGLVCMATEGNITYQLATDGAQFTWAMSINGINLVTLAHSLYLETGVWYMVTAWYDAASYDIGIAVNAGAAETMSLGGAAFNGNSTFVLGRDQIADASLSGRIDSVSCWQQTLNGSERVALFNSGAGLDYPFA